MANDLNFSSTTRTLAVAVRPADANQAISVLKEVAFAFLVFGGISVGVGVLAKKPDIAVGGILTAILGQALGHFRSRTVAILLLINMGSGVLLSLAGKAVGNAGLGLLACMYAGYGIRAAFLYHRYIDSRLVLKNLVIKIALGVGYGIGVFFLAFFCLLKLGFDLSNPSNTIGAVIFFAPFFALMASIAGWMPFSRNRPVTMSALTSARADGGVSEEELYSRRGSARRSADHW